MQTTGCRGGFNGGRVPFVLRPADDGYLFVGGYYVGGSMNENIIIGEEGKTFDLR